MREGKQTEKGGSLIRMYNVNEHYKILEKVGRGTYGTVYKARGLKDNKFYAIKKLENNDVKLQQQGFPITALREITLLKQIDHPNIIKLKEIILSRPNKRNLFRGSTFLVFQYMDHDFAGLFKMKRKFTVPEIKCIFKQLIQGVAYLHANKIFHRDIKSANILLNDEGQVKLADFGLGRKVRLQNIFTYKVVTLWYRAPQLLWGFKHYSDKIDVWSIGCVAVEFFTGEVLFKKESQHAQIERIYQICGDFEANDLRISEEAAKSYQYLSEMKPKKTYKKDIANYLRKMCPHITEISIQFIQALLHLDPSRRLSCEEALRHPFFNQNPTACIPKIIEKQEYECHEMFKDRSIKIQRASKKDHSEGGKIQKNPNKEDRGFKQQYKHSREKSITSQSKKREFSKSSSSASSKGRSRSRDKQFRRGSKSRQDNRRKFGYIDRKNIEREDDLRRDRYRREIREDHKDKREDHRDYKIDKERKIEEKDDRYYRDKHEKRYKDERRKDDRYDHPEDRIEPRRQGKDERRQVKEERREVKEERRQVKDERRDKDQRRVERRDYRRDSKQKKYDKYQKGRYDSRGYEPKNAPPKYRVENDQKEFKQRQQRRQERDKGHQNGKHQTSKQKYSGDYRSEKKSDKFVFVRQKGHRKKQVSSSSSPSSYSNHHLKKQKSHHRSKYSYDRKVYYKKQRSSSGQRAYH